MYQGYTAHAAECVVCITWVYKHAVSRLKDCVPESPPAFFWGLLVRQLQRARLP